MSSGLFKVVKGVKIELKPSEVKSQIMDDMGWDEATYNRERKKLTKRINTYNILMESGGGNKVDRTAVQILYAQSKSMQRYGSAYTPSAQTQAIYSMSATSGNIRGTKALEIARKKFTTYVNQRFSGLIQKNAAARKLAESISDPIKLEKALSDFANDMHEAIGDSKKKTDSLAIPFSSQSYGSESYDVDISAYLSDEDDDEDNDEDDMTEVDSDDIFY